MIKRKFNGALDSELFSRVREMYGESPNSFVNCAFPQGKARIEIALVKNTDAKRIISSGCPQILEIKPFP